MALTRKYTLADYGLEILQTLNVLFETGISRTRFRVRTNSKFSLEENYILRQINGDLNGIGNIYLRSASHKIIQSLTNLDK